MKGNWNIIVAIILAIIGIVWIIATIVTNGKLNSATGWYLTNATITNSVAQPVIQATDYTSVQASQIQLNNTTSSYIPRIVYTYTINGKNYQSNQVFYGVEQILNSSQIIPFMDKYRVGTTIPIYYNPANPQQAYIILSAHASYWGIILGIILILIAIWLYYYDRIKFSTSGIKISPASETSIGIKTFKKNNDAKIGYLY